MEKPLYSLCASSEAMAKWRADIESLPMRKQKKWHASCMSHEGTLHQVRFQGGYFQARVPETTGKGQFLLPAAGWAPIVAIGDELAPTQIVDAFGEEIMKRMGDFTTLIHPRSVRAVEADLQGGVDASNIEFDMIVFQNLTGQHHRNKSMKVPTTPGQPVRA